LGATETVAPKDRAWMQFPTCADQFGSVTANDAQIKGAYFTGQTEANPSALLRFDDNDTHQKDTPFCWPIALCGTETHQWSCSLVEVGLASVAR